MANSDPLQIKVPPGHFFKGHLPHLLALAALLPGTWAFAKPVLGDGSFLGLGDKTWYLAAIAVPILLQTSVALLWRAQLCFSTLTNLFGDAGFTVYSAIFFPLLLGRWLTMIGLSCADSGSLAIPAAWAIPLGIALLVPVAYAQHSVGKYLSFPRACGGDHFFERYRRMPMVREGAFRYFSHPVYTFVFLLPWAIAILARSQAGLGVALFQHAWIWVQWYAIEQADGLVLFGQSQEK